MQKEKVKKFLIWKASNKIVICRLDRIEVYYEKESVNNDCSNFNYNSNDNF